MDKHDIEKIGVREFRSELPKYLYGETSPKIYTPVLAMVFLLGNGISYPFS
jgi:hypothetical protein